MKTYNPKTMIKSAFSNDIHKIMIENLYVDPNKRWKTFRKLTDKQKLEIYELIEKVYLERSNELKNYLYEKREKKRVKKTRDLKKSLVSQ